MPEDAKMIETLKAAGGSSGKSGASGATEAPNTLRSAATVKVVDLLCEGEIGGLVDGAKSIFFNDTPLQDSEGEYNFAGFSWEARNGLPDQDYIPGFDEVDSETTLNLQIRKGTPYTHSLTDPDLDALRLTMQVPQLTFTDVNTGNVAGSMVQFTVEARYAGGEYQDIFGTVTIQGKCTSPYNKQLYFQLPKNPTGEDSAPWDIRIARLTDDHFNNPSITSATQNDLFIAAFTEVIQAKFSYPNSALIAMTFQAEQFASSVPTRKYDIYGRICQVPSNYDPETRAYDGVWDGTFKDSWHSNPAWVFYDLITNDRFGLGQFIDAAQVDKWGLYEIGVYCDEMVSDGYGGTEPRMAFNGVIQNQKQAFEALQSIATAFRGMAFWSSGLVMATQDRPQDPEMLVTPANVIDGLFDYKSSALKTRRTAVIVKWQNPDLNGETDYEVVEDHAAILRYGYVDQAIEAIGCTSRGQAHRYGKWVLFTDLYETQTVTYKAGLDHASLRPGAFIQVQDPALGRAEFGGRLKPTSTASQLDFDRDVTFEEGKTYSVSVVLPSGAVASQTLSVETYGSAVQSIALTTALDETPDQMGVWLISSDDLEPALFKIAAIREMEPQIYEVVALQHNDQKEAVVDGSALFDPRTPLPDYSVKPPIGLVITESVYFKNNQAMSMLTASWTPNTGQASVAYSVVVDTPDAGTIDFGVRRGLTFDLTDTVAGDYTFYISSVTVDGKQSRPLQSTFTAKGWENQPIPTVSDLQIQGGGSAFTGRTPTLEWTNTYDESLAPYPLTNVVRVYDAEGGTVLRTERVSTQSYSYDYDKNVNDGGPRRGVYVTVSCIGASGQEGTATGLAISNPQPASVTPVLTASIEQIFATWPINEPDYAGALVYASETTGFTPDETNLVYDGPNNAISFTVDAGTWYVRVGVYDDFGKAGITVGSEVSQSVNATPGADTSTPDAPDNLALTTAIDGSQVVSLTATWDAVDNVASYEAQIAEGSGNFIGGYLVTDPTMTWTGLKPNVAYSVRVRAISLSSVPSAFSATETLTSATNSTAPGAVTDFDYLATLKNVYLSWTNPTDADFDHVLIQMANNEAGTSELVDIGTTKGTAVTVTGLLSGATRYFFATAVNTSGVTQGTWTGPLTVTLPAIDGATDIAAGTIVGDRIAADTIEGNSLKVNTSLPATITVGETGVTIGDVQEASTNPAGAINANSTLIEPGKIQISGATTLASWRNGTDATKIEGGEVAANTLLANSMKIGLRGIGITNLDFTTDKDTNTVSWGGDGKISYVDDDGSVVEKAIDAGSVTVATGWGYIYWAKGATALSHTVDDAETPQTGDNVLLATYAGGAALIANYGGTLVDGSRVIAETITGVQIKALAIGTEHLDAESVTAEKLGVGSLTADKFSGGTITATESIFLGGTNFELSAANQNLIVSDGTHERVTLGKIDETNFGIVLRDANGATVVSTEATETSSGQCFYNSAINGTDGYVLGWNSSALVQTISTDLDSTWTVPGLHVGYVTLDGTPASGDVMSAEGWNSAFRYDVQTGQKVKTTAYLLPIRCNGWLMFSWFDASGTLLSEDTSSTVTASAATSGDTLANYTQVELEAVAPTGAVHFVTQFRASSTGDADPYLFFTVPTLEYFYQSNIYLSALASASADLGNITAGMIRSRDGNMQIDLNNNRIVIFGT